MSSYCLPEIARQRQADLIREAQARGRARAARVARADRRTERRAERDAQARTLRESRVSNRRGWVRLLRVAG